jgi:cytoskeletal protein CcmA (bactofilin family)
MGLSGTSTTLISKNTEVVGDIHFSGTLHIEGTLRGNVIAKGGNDAHLHIAENGVVEGQIKVPTVCINGKVIGDVFSTKHTELAAKAEVEGNVHYHLIEMVKGAQVNGSFVYTGDSGKKPQKAAGIDEPRPIVEPVAKTGSSSY